MNKLSIHCPHFAVCSGCILNDGIENPPVLADVKSYFEKQNIKFSVHAGSPIEWRCRAKLAVRGTPLNLKIGLYEKGTHQTVDIPLCKVHHPLINQAVEKVRAFIRRENIQPYDEETGHGILRYLQLVVERTSGKVQLVLVVNSERLDLKLQKLIESLWDESWHSIWVNPNTRRDNVIFGLEWLLIKGESLLWENFRGRQVCFHPASFAQANLVMFEELLEVMRAHVPPESVIVDYYAGVGVIGLSLVDKCKAVRCCEVVPQAAICFKASKEGLPVSLASKIKFWVGSTSKHLDLIEGADLVVVDPPRKGMEKELLKALAHAENLKKIIYVSCGWDSFKRDCDVLIASGWKLHKAYAFLFFPGSNHVEILAVFALI